MWAAEESCRQEGVIEVCIGRVRLATRQLFYCVAPKQSLFLLDAYNSLLLIPGIAIPLRICICSISIRGGLI